MLSIAQLVGSKMVHLPSPHPYQRDASICLAPRPTNRQLGLVAADMRLTYPDTLISSVSDHTLLIRGIPVVADSDHEADAITWNQIFKHATAALATSDDPDTKVASIDVRCVPGPVATTENSQQVHGSSDVALGTACDEG